MQACATFAIRQADRRIIQLRLRYHFQSFAPNFAFSPRDIYRELNDVKDEGESVEKTTNNAENGQLREDTERSPTNDENHVSNGGSQKTFKRQPRSANSLPRSPVLRQTLKHSRKEGSVGTNLAEDHVQTKTTRFESHNGGPRKAQRSPSRYQPVHAVDGESTPREVYIDRVKKGRPVLFAKRLKAAPFSTRFEMNPYAHALATPIRQDCFTGMHLPNSCLLAFNVVNSSSYSDKQSLLPMSLAVELVPSKKAIHRLTEEERKMREMWVEESRSPRQTFGGSYVINAESALRFVTEDSGLRVPAMVISRRVANQMTNNLLARHMSWRNDMPEFVLAAMRKVVMKKIAFFFRNKGNKDLPGLVCAVPGEDNLEALDDMDDVGCVLRLKPGLGPEEEGAETTDGLDHEDSRKQQQENHDTHQLETSTPVKPETREERAETTDDLDHEDSRKQQQDNDNTHQLEPSTPVEPEAVIDRLSDPNPDDDLEPEIQSPQVRLRALPDTWWHDVEPLHRATRPLPPPLRPPVLHYPSVKYRRRRIPIYGLPELLSDSAVDDMVKGTVFEDVKYVAMAQALGTIQAQVWLLKLQDHLARAKGTERDSE